MSVFVDTNEKAIVVHQFLANSDVAYLIISGSQNTGKTTATQTAINELIAEHGKDNVIVTQFGYEPYYKAIITVIPTKKQKIIMHTLALDDFWEKISRTMATHIRFLSPNEWRI